MTRLILALSLACTHAVGAQIMASRAASVVTLDTAVTPGFFTRSVFAAELQRARHSTADDLAWTIRTAGVWELYRWSDALALSGAAHQEVVANPYTSLGFNPRGVTWEEQLTLTHGATHALWQLGLFHRCRHEIDNSDPADQRTLQPEFVPAKRVVVLSGMQAAVLMRAMRVGMTRMRGALRVERYLAREDTRVPLAGGNPDWAHASTTVSGFARAERSGGSVRPYARAWGALPIFGGQQSSVPGGNARLEAGARFTGTAGGVDLFAAAETVLDDLATVTPRRSRLLGLGFRLSGDAFH